MTTNRVLKSDLVCQRFLAVGGRRRGCGFRISIIQG